MDDLLCWARETRQPIVVFEIRENAAPTVGRYSAMEGKTVSGLPPAA
jgi:hypothetical protein